MLFNILALISVIVTITLLRRLVNIFPTLLSCLVRWKENVNLEGSVKNIYDRNIIALGMTLPFCLAADRFRLYDLDFMETFGDDARLAITTGIFFTYFMIRRLASSMIRPARDGKKKTYEIANKASYTFFIILTIVLVLTGGLMSFINIDDTLTRSAMRWISAFTYALYILRKTQIFASSFSIFTSFLYLCALEIIPTGLLIAPALIF